MDCFELNNAMVLPQVLLLKQLIDYLAEDKDEEIKEFVKDFLNPNSSVSFCWLDFLVLEVWKVGKVCRKQVLMLIV